MESIDVKGHHGVASVNGAAIDSAITALSSHGLEVRCFVASLTHTAAVQQAVAAVDPWAGPGPHLVNTVGACGTCVSSR